MRAIRLTLTVSSILLTLLFAFNNCGVQTPSVDSSAAMVNFKHTGLETSCSACHETDRPAANNSVLHGNNADCVACHTAVNDDSIPLTTAFANNAQTFTHSNAITSCVSCHSNNRPSAVNNFPHFNNLDCVNCHNPNGNNTDGYTQTQITNAFFTSASYSHPNNITNCAACHAPLRPAAPHPQNGDCVSCHGTSDAWTQTTTADQIQALWSGTANQN